MTTSADHEGFAVSYGHEICPRRPVPGSSEVGELCDVVDFHLVNASACLAPSGQEPGDQLLAFGVDRGQPTVGDDRLLVLSQRDPAEPSDQWFPAGAFDAGLEARARPVRCVDSGRVGQRLRRQARSSDAASRRRSNRTSSVAKSSSSNAAKVSRRFRACATAARSSTWRPASVMAA